MIFVTVGSTDFDALVRKVDALCAQHDLKAIMQIGSGEYVPQNAQEYFRYAPSLDDYYDQADIVISHGGLGTVVEVLRQGRKLIAVSNPDRYDTHQDDLLDTLAEAGNLVWCRNLDDLEQDIRDIQDAHPVPYTEPECHIHSIIREFLRQRVEV